MLLLCIGCMITFALLFTSSPFNQMSSALAYGHSAKTPKTPDTGRLGANTQASPPKQSDWHPSKPDSKPGKSAPGKTAAHSDNTNGSGKGRKPGEQADMRTAFSKTFLNADGTWSQKTYSAPVHYKDGKGQWQDIDNTIVDDSSVTGYGLSNKASDWHAYFASASGGQTLMQVRFSGGSMSETLLGAKAVSAQKNGRQVAYSQVLPNTDLLYGLGAANLESTLLLHSVNAPVTYTFSYHVPGATATQEESGAIVFRDAGGKLLFAIGGTTMFEAKADGSLDPKGAGSDKVQVTLAGSAPDYTACR